MLSSRITLLVALLVVFSGCKQGSRELQVKVLLGEANDLLKQQSEVTGRWVNDFVTVFTAENRRQFPANRAFLQSHAEKILQRLDESVSLGNRAAEKYEQAARLSSDDQQRRGFVQVASSFRKDVEVDEIFTSQIKIVFDDTIVDAKSFNEKFSQSGHLIAQKKRESELDLAEGRRLLKW